MILANEAVGNTTKTPELGLVRIFTATFVIRGLILMLLPVNSYHIDLNDKVKFLAEFI